MPQASHVQPTHLSAGQELHELLPRLAAAWGGAGELEFVRLSVPHRAQTRLQESEAAQPLLDAARRARHEHGLAFWDSLLTATVRVGPDFPEELVDAALFHQDVEHLPSKYYVPAAELQTDWLTSVVGSLREREILVLRSRVAGPTEMHIPMLDMALPADVEHSSAVAARLLSHLGIHGYLFGSGRSFHFYGSALVSSERLTRFLGQALLLAPLVDERWIAHQLIEGSSALRVSAGSERQHHPRFVTEVRPPHASAEGAQ